MAQHNLRTVISFEVSRTLGKARFWAITLLVPIAIGIGTGLIILGNVTAANTADAQSDAELTFTYSDASGYVDADVAEALGGTAVTDEAAAIAAVKAEEQDAHFVYPADPTTTPTKGSTGSTRACSTTASTTASQLRCSSPAPRARSGTQR